MVLGGLMSIYGIKVSKFYKLCFRVFSEVRFPLRFSNFSKRMYGNFVHVFLLVYKERLNVSYRRFVRIVEESGLCRMLCIKRVPHFTTLQKFLQRVNKALFEKMVRACHKLLDLKNLEACVDGTGFSNTNPSHHYIKRVDGVQVKNYTKTTFLTDNNTKLVLNVKTHSDHASEALDFVPLIHELKSALSCVLADKAHDSATSREYCWNNGIEVHIPLRDWKNNRRGYGHLPHFSKKRKKAEKLFDPVKYKRRALIESVNSAIKRTLGGWLLARNPSNQQKQATLKALTYNLEILDKTIKIQLYINN